MKGRPPAGAAEAAASVTRGVPATAGVVGHGVDLVAIDRVAEMLERHGERFAERCFTSAERTWADAGGARRAERYAGRFAAKEAAAKALGTGIAEGVAWTDLEVLPDERGAPRLRLHGAAAERADAMGARRVHCSISHASGLAFASVVASR